MEERGMILEKQETELEKLRASCQEVEARQKALQEELQKEELKLQKERQEALRMQEVVLRSKQEAETDFALKEAKLAEREACLTEKERRVREHEIEAGVKEEERMLEDSKRKEDLRALELNLRKEQKEQIRQKADLVENTRKQKEKFETERRWLEEERAALLTLSEQTSKARAIVAKRAEELEEREREAASEKEKVAADRRSFEDNKLEWERKQVEEKERLGREIQAAKEACEAALKAEKKAAEAELVRARESAAQELAKEKSRLDTRRAEEESRIHALENELKEREVSVSIRERANDAEEKRVDEEKHTLVTVRADLERERNELFKVKDESETSAGALEEEWRRCIVWAVHVEAESKKLEEESARARERAKELDQRSESLDRREADARRRIEKLEKQEEDVSVRVRAFEQRETEWEEGMKERETTSGKLRSDFEAASTAHAAAQAAFERDRAAAEDALRGAEQSMDARERNLARREAELQDRSGKVAAGGYSLEERRRKLESDEKAMRDSEAKLRERESELGKLKQGLEKEKDELCVQKGNTERALAEGEAELEKKARALVDERMRARERAGREDCQCARASEHRAKEESLEVRDRELREERDRMEKKMRGLEVEVEDAKERLERKERDAERKAREAERNEREVERKERDVARRERSAGAAAARWAAKRDALQKLEQTAEEKETKIRRLQAELQRILRQRKEAARSVATQTVDERAVNRGAVEPLSAVNTSVASAGIAAQTGPARGFRSTESRRATESAVVIDDEETPVGILPSNGRTPVVLPDLSPVEVSGTRRNGVLQPSGTGGATRPRGNPVSESPSFLDLGAPALDAVRVNLFPSDRAERRERNRRAESRPERLDAQPKGRRQSEEKSTAGQTCAEKPRFYSATRYLSDATEKGLNGLEPERNGIFDREGFGKCESETPQMPRALLDRAATLEQAARQEVSPRDSFRNLHPEKDCGGRPEPNGAERKKASAPRAETDRPERAAAERPRSGICGEARGSKFEPQKPGENYVQPEGRCKPHALCLTPPDYQFKPPGTTSRYENGRRSGLRSPADCLREPGMMRVEGRRQTIRDGWSEGETGEPEEDRFYTPDARDISPGGDDSTDVSSRGAGDGGEDGDGFFTPCNGRQSWGWDPARDPLPSSKEGLLELRDALQLRVQELVLSRLDQTGSGSVERSLDTASTASKTALAHVQSKIANL
ncbi:hypothetical protein KFL_001430170 [Klebsormidium nitens]|uniref:Uncharacterized protein n=1 Tax=Klebsormidium nitens TaxID=105231 RepID=A0A1Y1I009_KLENI|nr:hypothetical protein KFL_001430170 [Klebsormidium nitens]|eukprot:GAQ83312.1 hypothetical protein KFL_001430170 [Klebsormidium nitens]